MSERQAIIIGAGLAGISTAWTLRQRGWDVLVMDRAERPAEGASHANAGAFTPSEPEPWNGPGVGRQLAASLFDPAAAMKLRLAPLPGLIPWGLRFLIHSTPRRHHQAALANFALARYSQDETRKAREALGLTYDQSARGSLKVCRDEAGLAAARAAAEALAPSGLNYQPLDPAGCVALEPQLAAVQDRLKGGIAFPDDESGDARAFVLGLAEAAEKAGVEFEWGAEITALRDRAGRIVGVDTEKEIIEADAVILAAGHEAWRLMRPHGLHLPVRPVKGYSITFDLDGVSDRPGLPVVDDQMHAIVTPLGDRLRVAGTAEIAGENTELRPERIANLLELLEALYPDIAAALKGREPNAWAGLRPISADGRPFIGETRARGLWLSAGHGHLGWTMAMGSAALLADLMEDKTPAIDPAPYRADRI